MKRILGLLVVAATLVGTANAQYSTKGFSLRPHLVGVSWSFDDFETDAQGGGGLGLGLAYGFSEVVSIYTEFSGAQIQPDNGDDYALGHFDLGVLFTLGSRESAWRFLLNLAANGRSAVLDQPGAHVEVSGAGGTLGGGVLYFTSRNFGIEGGLEFTGGELTEVKVNGITWTPQIDATSVRLNLGVVWFPGRD